MSICAKSDMLKTGTMNRNNRVRKRKEHPEKTPKTHWPNKKRKTKKKANKLPKTNKPQIILSKKPLHHIHDVVLKKKKTNNKREERLQRRTLEEDCEQNESLSFVLGDTKFSFKVVESNKRIVLRIYTELLRNNHSNIFGFVTRHMKMKNLDVFPKKKIL